MGNNSCLVIEQRFGAWGMIYLNENANVIVYPANMFAGDALDMALSKRFSKIYILWYRGFGAFDGYEFNENYIGKDNIAVYTLRS